MTARSAGGQPKSAATAWWKPLLRPSSFLLLAVPVAVGMKLAGVTGVPMFVAASIGVLPLAHLIGRATEVLAEHTGSGVGGLLNATFGNAAELILALNILARGPDLYPVVRASLTGSILANLLLVLGASIMLGGLRYSTQSFNRTAAGVGTTLLAIAAAGMLIPTLFYYLPHAIGADGTSRIVNLSEEIAVVLLLLYGASLLFSLRTHAHLYGDTDEEEESDDNGDAAPRWSTWTAVGVLLATIVTVAFLSEWLVGSIEAATQSWGMNHVFVGVVIVGIVGNAAEHASACQMAWKGKMDLALRIAISSTTQVALFVAPVLLFSSLLMGHAQPLDLHFGPLEVVGIVASIAVVSLVARDGKSNWLEGVMLLALYVIIALAFFNLPESAGAEAAG